MHYLEVFRILPGTFQTSPRTSILLSVPPRPLSSQLIRQLHRCVNLYLLNIGAACIPTSIELTWVNSVSPSPLSTLSLSVCPSPTLSVLVHLWTVPVVICTCCCRRPSREHRILPFGTVRSGYIKEIRTDQALEGDMLQLSSSETGVGLRSKNKG